MIDFFVDGDACPVKDVIAKVSTRYQLRTVVVSAGPMKLPKPLTNQVAGAGFNAADLWIAENIKQHDLLSTADIELAANCIKKGAFVLDFNGKLLDDDNIGSLMASRELMGMLRDTQFDQEKKIKKRSNRNNSSYANELENILRKIFKLKNIVI